MCFFNRGRKINLSVIHLDRNEYFFDHHPKIREIFLNFNILDISCYATFTEQENLTFEIAKIFNLENLSKVTLFHGAEDALIKILSWFRKSYNLIIMEDFCWNNYEYICNSFEYKIEKVTNVNRDKEVTLDLDFLQLSLIKKTPCLVLLTLPNNPTGHLIPIMQLKEIIIAFPQHVFILDIVYSDMFCNEFLQICSLENVIIIGSFSKLFGLPGLRVGYAVGMLPEAFKLKLGIQKQNILACLRALNYKEYYLQQRKQMLEYAMNLTLMPLIHLAIYRTSAPFILIEIKDTDINQSIFSEIEFLSGVKPKYFAHAGKNFMRFSLGPYSIFKKIEKYLKYIG